MLLKKHFLSEKKKEFRLLGNQRKKKHIRLLKERVKERKT